MNLEKALPEELMVRPGASADLDRRDTATAKVSWAGSDKSKNKIVAGGDLRSFVDELVQAQQLFWVSDTHALLIILQATDAVGQDGTIRHVLSGVDPQGCRVESFKEPTAASRFSAPTQS
jgi:polyphosphate kinase 2 (PPK2 family)